MKLTKLCLFLVALFATVCLLGCPGDPEITPIDKGPIDDSDVNYFDNPTFDPTKVKEVAFIDFNNSSWKLKDFAPQADGATIEDVENAGIKGSNCIRVTQSESYGQILIHAEDAYSRGKTYYFEAWFRDDATPVEVNQGETVANLSITCYDKDIVDLAAAYGKEYYDYDSSFEGYVEAQPTPYDASAEKDITGFEEALDPILARDEDGDLEGLLLSEVISNTEWTRLNGIVYSKDIDSIVNAEGRGQEDLVGFFLNFFCGTYPDQAGYIYFVDNIRVLDLNPEIPEGNGKHIDPPSLSYGKDNNIVINIMDGDHEEVWFSAKSARATFSITEGELPEGIVMKDNGDLEGTIDESFVEEGGEPRVFTVKIKAVNKAGEDEQTVTITIMNQEIVEEEEPENTEGGEGTTTEGSAE